jgi:malate dehydrogenase
VYAPGNAVSAMIDAISRNRRKILPVSAFLEGEYGYSNVCLGVPCVLGSNGIEKIVELDLNREEKETFTKGVQSVETAIRELPL